MRGAAFGCLAILGLAWSGLAWLFYSIVGSGGAAVVTLSRWLQLEPASTQWLADLLDLVGTPAQWLVILIWLIGMGTLGLIAAFSVRLQRESQAILAQQAAARPQPYTTVDGEIQSKTVDGKTIRPDETPPPAG